MLKIKIAKQYDKPKEQDSSVYFCICGNEHLNGEKILKNTNK